MSVWLMKNGFRTLCLKIYYFIIISSSNNVQKLESSNSKTSARVAVARRIWPIIPVQQLLDIDWKPVKATSNTNHSQSLILRSISLTSHSLKTAVLIASINCSGAARAETWKTDEKTDSIPTVFRAFRLKLVAIDNYRLVTILRLSL